MSKLYVVATPIGNLEDVTKRSLRILREADFVLSEDTRTTRKLLNHFEIKTPIESYHQHSGEEKTEHILDLLDQGNNLALVTEAGTPAISDPGSRLIDRVYKTPHEIIPIPGPSALTTIASVSGFSADKFLFLGFPPKKKGRADFFKEVVSSKYPVVFYESPHRIIKTLNELQGALEANNKENWIVVGRELTKKFESIYRGPITKVISEIKKDPVKGEFTVMIDNSNS